MSENPLAVFEGKQIRCHSADMGGAWYVSVTNCHRLKLEEVAGKNTYLLEGWHETAI